MCSLIAQASAEIGTSLSAVQMLRCPRCRDFTALEALDCPGCGFAVGFDPPTLTMYEATPDGVSVDGRTWIPARTEIGVATGSSPTMRVRLGACHAG